MKHLKLFFLIYKTTILNTFPMEFLLRPWQLSDLPSLVRYANNWSIAKNMTDKFPHPYTEENGNAFIAFANSDTPVHIFAITVQDEAVGGIGIHPQEDIHRKNAELGYWLAEPFWGKGIISKAIYQMVNFAFDTYDISRVFARPFGTNLTSQRVLEKNSFLLEGRFEKVLYKNGEYLDELIYAVRRETWEKKS
jgi:RimJ/RimL family protein N-acetyltransferase